MSEFWENQSLNSQNFIHSISNLSYDEEFSIEKSNAEKEKINKLLSSINRTFNSCLEVGAGTCQWTKTLSDISYSVLATDTSKGMLKIGKKYILKNATKNNIKFFLGDITNETNPINTPYDLIFISGLILYLNQKELIRLLEFMNFHTNKGAFLILREPIGVHKEYILDNVYSKELKSNYSAIYRTEKNIINIFEKYKFNIYTNEWLHTDNSKFNKWEETRLKLISFKRI